MEEVLNDLISIDVNCRKKLQELQDKKDNIEYLVNDELTKRKNEIKTKYKFKIDMKKSEYQIKLEDNKKQIENNKMREIEQMKYKYDEEKENKIRELIQSILQT